MIKNKEERNEHFVQQYNIRFVSNNVWNTKIIFRVRNILSYVLMVQFQETSKAKSIGAVWLYQKHQQRVFSYPISIDFKLYQNLADF